MTAGSLNDSPIYDLATRPWFYVVFPVLYKGGGNWAGLERKADTETSVWGFTSVNRSAKTSERAAAAWA